ncbi:hypothetical protein SY83_17505 [Paenibacillus swuensis]|uniref:Endonuclease n=1 Tax=Paenibacillus swuensis TaxID=1178515 RepID=A0A172TL69_9BACL|nr:hypothetical protein [Paenibacillus swuensis]ANE47781.1 hypothetical protein SY83_17505 [Paenibacillus swuensis]
MMKKLFTGVMLLAIVLAVAACSNNKPTEEEVAKTNQVAYNAVKVAVVKVNALFHHDVAADETTPVMTSKTKEDAKEILDGYFDGALSDAIITHYVTDKKAEDRVVVNAEPFFKQELLASKFEDVTVEAGEEDEHVVTTKDAGKFTVKHVEDGDKFIVTKYE